MFLDTLPAGGCRVCKEGGSLASCQNHCPKKEGPAAPNTPGGNSLNVGVGVPFKRQACSVGQAAKEWLLPTCFPLPNCSMFV